MKEMENFKGELTKAINWYSIIVQYLFIIWIVIPHTIKRVSAKCRSCSPTYQCQLSYKS